MAGVPNGISGSGDQEREWIVNTARADRTAHVTLDLPRLGIKTKPTVVYDIETGDPVPLAAANLAAAKFPRSTTLPIVVFLRASP
jgi:hypothetical protein